MSACEELHAYFMRVMMAALHSNEAESISVCPCKMLGLYRQLSNCKCWCRTGHAEMHVTLGSVSANLNELS